MVAQKFFIYLFLIIILISSVGAIGSEEEEDSYDEDSQNVNSGKTPNLSKFPEDKKSKITFKRIKNINLGKDIDNQEKDKYLNILGDYVRKFKEAFKNDNYGKNNPSKLTDEQEQQIDEKFIKQKLEKTYFHMLNGNEAVDKEQDEKILRHEVELKSLWTIIYCLIASIVLLFLAVIYLMVTVYSMNDTVSKATCEEWEKILKEQINCNDAVVAKFKLSGLDNPSLWGSLSEEDLLRLGFEDHNLIIWKRTYGVQGFSVSSSNLTAQTNAPTQVINEPWAMTLRHNIGCSEEAINSFQKAHLTIESEWSKKSAIDYALHSMGLTSIAIANFKQQYLKETLVQVSTAAPAIEVASVPGSGFVADGYTDQNDFQYDQNIYEQRHSDPAYMNEAIHQTEPISFNPEQLMQIQNENQNFEQYDLEYPNYIDEQNYQQY